jgi:hypothetical protein
MHMHTHSPSRPPAHPHNCKDTVWPHLMLSSHELVWTPPLVQIALCSGLNRRCPHERLLVSKSSAFAFLKKLVLCPLSLRNCFTSTKVQILTQVVVLRSTCRINGRADSGAEPFRHACGGEHAGMLAASSSEYAE